MEVSVIIPMYNAEKYITKALMSCLKIEAIKEIIVIDDGYPDKAFDEVKLWATKHSIIKLISHPNRENKGAGASRNLGIQNATQPYIAFLDADDFFLPNRFSKDQQIFQENPIADGVYNAIGSYFYSDLAKQEFLQSFHSEITTISNSIPAEKVFDELIGFNRTTSGHFSIIGLTVKTEVFKNKYIKFPESSMYEDSSFTFKLAYYTNLFPGDLGTPVAVRGIHPENRITANQQNKLHKYTANYKLYKELYQWAIQSQIKGFYIEYFKQNREYFRLMMNTDKRAFSFLKEIIKNKNLLRHKKYIELHKSYLGKIPMNHILYKLRNLVVNKSI